MVRTAIQLQTLDAISDDLPATIRRVGKTTLQGVELWDPAVSSPSVVADALEAGDLEVVGGHVSLERFETEYDAVLEAYDTMECQRLIVPKVDPDAFESIEGIDALARRVTTLADRLVDDGFELYYHNHSYEFTRLEGRTGFDAFVERTGGNLAFELDAGLALYAGADPVEVLARYGDRIRLLHLSDSVPGSQTTRQVELGAGELDVEACVDAAREVDVEWLVYEHGMTSDPLDSLNYAASKLSAIADGHAMIPRSERASTTD